MIELIRQLVQLLSRDISVPDVINEVGSVWNDPGGLLPIELEPTVPGVRSVSLSRDIDSGMPYVLTIEPTSETSLTPNELEQVFGSFKRLRTDRGQPPEIIFYPPKTESPWHVVIVATLESVVEPLNEQQVTSVSLRRDLTEP